MEKKQIEKDWKLYVLRLEKNKYYVGITSDIGERLVKHFQGKGSKFTQKFKPLSCVFEADLGHLSHKDAVVFENIKVLQIMVSFGIENVRGGAWCQVETVMVKSFMKDSFGGVFQPYFDIIFNDKIFDGIVKC